MGASIIDGKALAAATKAEAAEKVTALKAQGVNPCLAVILVGENPASQVYVRGKINDCAQCGIESRSINLPADTTQETLLAEVKKLADDPAVHGILVQLPLPEQIDEKAVIDVIPPEKDVDGFSPINVGRMQIGEPCYLPCTPAGCIRMIESTGTEIAGKNAVVIGRSNIVGKPAALLLLAKNATVTICHSKTKNLKGSAPPPIFWWPPWAARALSPAIWSSPAPSSSTWASTAALTASCTATSILPRPARRPVTSPRCPAALAP